jgi:hypothetical protein
MPTREAVFLKMDSRDFPLSSNTKQAILNGIFNCGFEAQDFENDSNLGSSYFEYYRKAVDECSAHSTVMTHEDIVNVVILLKQPNTTGDAIEITLGKQISDEEVEDSYEVINDSINLALRLLLMMPTGVFASTGRPIALSGETKLDWKDGTVSELVNNELSPQDSMKENVKLEKIFNARNLERIAGIKIRWTSNLADHLRMRDDDKAVEIFHYASFLKFHQHW